MSNNLGYALAVEKLAGIEVPERAEYIRVIMAELTRALNHMWSIGFILNDLGALQTPALYAVEEREIILDLFEEVSGARLMCNYMRFGGVMRDLTEGWEERASIWPTTASPARWTSWTGSSATTRLSRPAVAASATCRPKT